MQSVYSVSQVNNYIKNMFTQDFLLNRILIRGEVSNCKYHSSGHIYFTLKDQQGALSAVMFASSRRGLGFQLADGQKVLVGGSVNIYERDGKYQLYAKEITLDGIGILYQKFEALKKELEEMGMFAPEYKQPIPKYISKLGVVTASTGAAVRDIIHVVQRRNPHIAIVVFPAQVQGEGAAESIVKGIQCLEKYGVDCMIVGRGGGSIEDLWAFNEEMVARAIFECSIPVISAVGHETDTTIADFVADMRAPTPSAAAEIAAFDYIEFQNKLNQIHSRFGFLVKGKIEFTKSYLKQYEVKIQHYNPENQIREKRQYCIDIEERLKNRFQNILKDRRYRLMLFVEKMEGLSPLKKLSQGFSYVSNSGGKSINKIEQIEVGELLKVHVTNGVVTTEVIEMEEIRRDV